MSARLVKFEGTFAAYSVQKYLHRESLSSLESIFGSPYFYFSCLLSPNTQFNLFVDFADVNAIIKRKLPYHYPLDISSSLKNTSG